MNKVIVRSEASDVSNRLGDFDLTRSLLLEIIDACVLYRNGVNENDPPGTAGFESYRWGTRRARELLCVRGWERDNTGGFATVVNHRRRFRMVFMNADDGTGTLDGVPQNRCKKGANSEKVAARNGFLFGPEELPIPPSAPYAEDGYSTWHLCVFIKGDPDKELTVRAELTLLSEFEGGYFTNFAEKILLLQDGEWPGGSKDNKDSGDDDEDQYEVKVVRRK
jgi:hypothetical protein